MCNDKPVEHYTVKPPFEVSENSRLKYYTEETPN
jgi:hypothetical protein